jgi:hypothetical protein
LVEPLSRCQRIGLSGEKKFHIFASENAMEVKKKKQILVDGNGKFKMNLEHLFVPERKEVLKNKRVGLCLKDKGTNLKEPPMAKDGTTEVRK